jgi:hypothetical protein
MKTSKVSKRFAVNPLCRINQQNVNTKTFLHSGLFNVSGIRNTEFTGACYSLFKFFF